MTQTSRLAEKMVENWEAYDASCKCPKCGRRVTEHDYLNCPMRASLDIINAVWTWTPYVGL